MENLLAESLESSKTRTTFIDQLLEESGIKKNDPLHQLLMDYLLAMKPAEMVKQVIAGIKKSEIKNAEPSLADLAEDPDIHFIWIQCLMFTLLVINKRQLVMV